MKKAIFTCKESTLDDVLSIIHNQLDANPHTVGESYFIAREKVLSEAEWSTFTESLLDDRDWLSNFARHQERLIRNEVHDTSEYDSEYVGEGEYNVRACILVSSPTSRIGLLIDPQGHNYARYVGVIDREDMPVRQTKEQVDAYIKKMAGAFGFTTEPSGLGTRMNIRERDTHFLNFTTKLVEMDVDYKNVEVTYRVRFSASLASMGGNPSPSELLQAAGIIHKGAMLVMLLNEDEITYTINLKG